MDYNFNIRINVDDNCELSFKNEQEVKNFVIEELAKFACVNSIKIDTRRYDLQKLASFIPNRNMDIPMVNEDKIVTINLKELSDVIWKYDIGQWDYHFIDAPIMEAHATGIGKCFNRVIELSKN